MNHNVEILHSIAKRADPSERVLQEGTTIGTSVGWIRVGKQLADVGESGRSEQRIGHRMKNDVGVAMSDEPLFVRDFDAAEYQSASRFEAVNIVSETDPE